MPQNREWRNRSETLTLVDIGGHLTHLHRNCMRVLGIDYGKRRIGVAFSDENAQFAFPQMVIAAGKEAAEHIMEIAVEKGVRIIVLGESKDLNGRANALMEAISSLKAQLEAKGFTVVLQPEYESSIEAERFQGKNDMSDASAAAIILQRYLDTQKAI